MHLLSVGKYLAECLIWDFKTVSWSHSLISFTILNYPWFLDHDNEMEKFPLKGTPTLNPLYIPRNPNSVTTYRSVDAKVKNRFLNWVIKCHFECKWYSIENPVNDLMKFFLICIIIKPIFISKHEIKKVDQLLLEII